MSRRKRRRAAVPHRTPTAPLPTPLPQPVTGGHRAALSRALERWEHPRPKAQDGGLFAPRAMTLHPPTVARDLQRQMATDDGELVGAATAWAQQWPGVGLVSQGFLGFPILAELSLRPEYRRIIETFAGEMTREWIELKSIGDEDKSKKIGILNDLMQHFKLKENFNKGVQHDGAFGRGHLFVDLGVDEDDKDELLTPIGNGRNETSKNKVAKGSLKRFGVIEPIWIYPIEYNAHDPLAADWYVARTWAVMNRMVNHSRLLTLIGRPVPDLFKAQFSFCGLSLTQIVQPYVEKFVKDAMNISELVAAFSIMVLSTELSTSFGVGSEELARRLDLFVKTRNNLGLMVLDKSTGEQLSNVSAPLGGLEGLQAQSQEHILSAAGMPAIKYTGLTPTGLNASSEGEIKSWQDNVHASQEFLLREPITAALGFIQLSEFGEVDPGITFDFVSLHQLSETEKIDIQAKKAAIHEIYLTARVVSEDTVRKSVAADPDSPYHGIDLSQDKDLDLQPEIGEPSAPGEAASGEPLDPVRHGAELANALRLRIVGDDGEEVEQA